MRASENIKGTAEAAPLPRHFRQPPMLSLSELLPSSARLRSTWFFKDMPLPETLENLSQKTDSFLST